MHASSILRPRALAAAGLPLLLALGPAPASAQGTPATAAYVVRLGSDTIAVEEFTRTADSIRGRQVVRSPRTQIREYSGALRPDGTLSSFAVAFRTPGDAQPSMRGTVEFAADSATVRVMRGDSTQTYRVAAAVGAIPLVSYSVGLYELPLARAAGSRLDSLRVALVPVGNSAAVPSTIRRTGSGQYTVANVAGSNRVRVDAQGRLLAWDGSASTLKIVTERAPRVALDSLAAAFAARDGAGRGFGTASPRDSLQARVGEATVSVNYGRPSLRGRPQAQLLPAGQVWRTGANQATHLRTDRDLVIGGARVPAGAYTLWTIPGEREWTLIVNKQTGQWGTVYDAAQDLARVPMRVERASTPVETFAIAVEPQGAGSVLALTWGTVRATVPVAPAGS